MTTETNIGGKTFLTNASWTLCGNIVYSACQWGMLALLAKMTNPELVGRFSLGLAVSAPIIIFSQLQLRAVQATDVSSKTDFSLYLGLRIALSCVAFAVIAAICALAKYDTITTGIILVLTLAKIIESISDVIFGLFQQRSRLDYQGKSVIFKAVLSISCFGLVLWLTHDLTCAAVALALAWAVVLITYDLPTARRLLGGRGQSEDNPLLPVFDFHKLKPIAVGALPLGISSLLYTLAPNIPRYFLDHLAGRRELGIYSALSYVIIAGTTVINAVGTAAVNGLAASFASRDARGFLTRLGNLLGLALLMGLVAFGLTVRYGAALLTLAYGREYGMHHEAFVWIVGAGGLSYIATVLGYALVATRRFAVQVPLHVVITVCTALSCWLFVSRLGLMGAVFGLLTGSCVAIILTASLLFTLLAPMLRSEPAPSAAPVWCPEQL